MAKKKVIAKPSVETIRKHVGIMKKLAAKGKGKLPSYTWLNDNGYFRSYEIMRMYPSYFRGIKRSTLRRAA